MGLIESTQSNPRTKMAHFACSLVLACGLNLIQTTHAQDQILTDVSKDAFTERVLLDLSDTIPGDVITVEWEGIPVTVIHRTDHHIEQLGKDLLTIDPTSQSADYPFFLHEKWFSTKSYVHQSLRSQKDEYFVGILLSTIRGCAPFVYQNTYEDLSEYVNAHIEMLGGLFWDPCDHVMFDFSGRSLINQNQKQPSNLVIPAYEFIDAHTLMLGETTD